MFKVDFKLKMIVAVAVVSPLFFVGCLPKSKKYEPPKITVPEVPEVKLPNGDILKNMPKVHVDETVWADGVRTRAKSCVESICSIPYTTYFELEDEGYFLRQEEIDQLATAKQKFEDEIWPKMLAYINKDQEKSQQELRDILEFYEDSPASADFGITKFTENYIKFSYSQSLLKDFESEDYDYSFLESNKELRLKESVITKIPDDQKEYVKIALRIFTKLIFSDAYQNSNLIEKYGLRIFLLYKYDKTDIKKAKETFIAEINNNLSQIEQYLPLLSTQIRGGIGFKKLTEDKDMLPVEEVDVAETYQAAALMVSLLNDPWEEFDQLGISMDSLVSRASILETINERIEQDGNKRFQASKDKTYSICKESIAAHLVSRPSKNSIDEFNEHINKVKVEAKNQANLLYPNQELLVEQMINDAKFSLPSAEEEAINQIEESIQFFVDELGNRPDMKNLSDIDAVNLGGMIVGMQKFLGTEKDDSFEGLSDMCLTYLPKGLKDHTYTFENKVVVSTNTVISPLAGAAVVAHELGHRVQAELGNTSRQELNQCLIDRHFTWTKDEKDPSSINTKQFFDEDYADNFSTKIMTALGMTEKTNNLGCLLFGTSNETGGRVRYFGSNTTHPLVINNTDDSHAASLHRLLQIANDLNHSTQVCKDFYAEEKKNIYFINKTEIVRVPEIKTCN